MTPAQTAFAAALGAMSALIVWFTLYVLSSTAWAGRWMRRERR